MIARRAALFLPLIPAAALAQPAPAAVVEGFHDTLLGVMRDARRLGVRGRYDRLAPAMARAFDLAAMARISIGPPWTGFAPTEQQALADAFARWSVATYAARFDGFSGESFTTQGVQALPNGDALVRTTLSRTGGQEPVVLSYLVRQGRIVDIYLTGTISELASRRSEFAALLREGGAARLLAELEGRTQRLLAG